jgi:hypothetical protein
VVHCRSRRERGRGTISVSLAISKAYNIQPTGGIEYRKKKGKKSIQHTY